MGWNCGHPHGLGWGQVSATSSSSGHTTVNSTPCWPVLPLPQVGVSCRKGGFFFNKRAKGFYQEDRPFMLAVEDPNDPDNDLGKNSYNIARVRGWHVLTGCQPGDFVWGWVGVEGTACIQVSPSPVQPAACPACPIRPCPPRQRLQVRMAFDYAYCQLIAPCQSNESLLGRIIRLDPVLFLRAPPPHYPDQPAPRPAGKRQRQHAQEEEEEEQDDRDQRRGRRERKKSGGGLEHREGKRAREVVAAAPEGGGHGGGKRQKRRHRERSESDEDLDVGGSRGGRWQMAEEGDVRRAVEVAEEWEEAEEAPQARRRQHAKSSRPQGHHRSSPSDRRSSGGGRSHHGSGGAGRNNGHGSGSYQRQGGRSGGFSSGGGGGGKPQAQLRGGGGGSGGRWSGGQRHHIRFD